MQTENSSINFAALPKAEKYSYVQTALRGLCDGEKNRLANMANATALLKEVFGWWWVGFYLVDGNELVLGPFQGPVACTRITKGKGVCGTCWQSGEIQVVPDVHVFPGHIACSAASNSEIVVPMLVNGDIIGVLDADSEYFSHFDETDAEGLKTFCEILHNS